MKLPAYILLISLLSSLQSYAQTPTLVKDIYPGPSSSVQSYSNNNKHYLNANGLLYFPAWDGVNGIELWRSDGTSAGTYMVKDIYSGSGNSNPSDLTYVNGIVYFIATDVLHGYELWRSDGTANGTYIVKDIYPDASSGSTTYPSITDVNGTIYFQAIHPTFGYSLWKTDGTEGGTVYITNGAGNTSYNTHVLGEMAAVGGALYFVMDGVAPNSIGYELWRVSSPTSNPVLVKDINSGSASSNPYKLTKVNNLLFFLADDGARGYELFRSDGTSGGTFMTKELYPGNNSNRDYIADLTEVNGVLFFFFLGAPNASYDPSLWRSDGSVTGTYLVKNIRPITSTTAYSVNVNNIFYFVPSAVVGEDELWRSDGTDSGTYLVKDITPNSNGAGVGNLTNVNGTLYFTAYQGPLWRSDGTAAGTTSVYPIPTNQPNNLFALTPTTDKLFFGAATSNTGSELWVLPLTSQLICQSLQSGNWEASSTWSCGHVPTTNDVAVISPGHTITVSTTTAQAQQVINKGKINFSTAGTKVFIKGSQ